MPDVGFMLLCKAAQQQEQLNQAATIIQAHYRRYAAQKQFQQLRQAASTIQQHATRFLQRREAAQEREREERAKRFKAVMTRHHERIQQLELEKQRLRDLPIGQLDAYEGKRHAAAIIIQAHWRGSKQREAVRAKHSGLLALRPTTCRSPTTKHQPTGSNHHQQPSTASLAARSAVADSARSSRAGGLSSSRHLQAEASSTSTALTSEYSKLSAAAAAAVEGTNGRKRSAAIPVARQMVLERQVQLRVDAFKAAHSGSGRFAALRAARDSTDQRLVQLLQEHQAAASGHLKGARRRQKMLQKAEMLYSQLQQLPQLAQLANATDASQLPILAADIAVTERARQAHALALAEAKVGGKWWLPLKLLNQQNRDAAVAGVGSAEHQEWEQQHAAWKANWATIVELEGHQGVQFSSKQQQGQHVVIEQELSSESSWLSAA